MASELDISAVCLALKARTDSHGEKDASEDDERCNLEFLDFLVASKRFFSQRISCGWVLGQMHLNHSCTLVMHHCGADVPTIHALGHGHFQPENGLIP